MSVPSCAAPRGRRPAWAARLVAALLLVAASLVLGGVDTAAAAGSDSYDRFDIAYVVGADGIVHAHETITLRFGPGSGRHGYDRLLVTREPSGEAARPDTDVLFPVSNVRVTSPDPVSTETAITTDAVGDARHELTRIRIGSSDRTIAAPTVTYVITYDQAGLVRGPDPAFDEFYVDALGPALGPVSTSTVTVGVPGGARDVTCWAGPAQSTAPCTSKLLDGGAATFTQVPLAAGDIFTIDAKITKGAAGAASRLYAESGVVETARRTLLGQIVGAVMTALMVASTAYFRRRKPADRRFAGVPPGTIPADADSASTLADPIRAVPVCFSPPRLPLMDAGYLLDRESRVCHLAATLVGLATAGAIELRGPRASDGAPEAIPRSWRRIPDEPSRILYRALFKKAGVTRVVFADRRLLAPVATRLYEGAAARGRAEKWFAVTSSSAPWLVGFFSMIATIPVIFLLGSRTVAIWWVVGPPFVAYVALAIWLGVKPPRQVIRSATGRAWTDQIEGFRTYLATAEADELRFDEGEDIFSRYLPWAVLFGLTERWIRVCRQAVDCGLLARPDTAWCGGGAWEPDVMVADLGAWCDTVASEAGPVPQDVGGGPTADAVAFDGSGFGGDSGFDGGGSSGGGDGGGGGGSW